jgi:hypothetical protein
MEGIMAIMRGITADINRITVMTIMVLRPVLLDNMEIMLLLLDLLHQVLDQIITMGFLLLDRDLIMKARHRVTITTSTLLLLGLLAAMVEETTVCRPQEFRRMVQEPRSSIRICLETARRCALELITSAPRTLSEDVSMVGCCLYGYNEIC